MKRKVIYRKEIKATRNSANYWPLLPEALVKVMQCLKKGKELGQKWGRPEPCMDYNAEDRKSSWSLRSHVSPMINLVWWIPADKWNGGGTRLFVGWEWGREYKITYEEEVWQSWDNQRVFCGHNLIQTEQYEGLSQHFQGKKVMRRIQSSCQEPEQFWGSLSLFLFFVNLFIYFNWS